RRFPPWLRALYKMKYLRRIRWPRKPPAAGTSYGAASLVRARGSLRKALQRFFPGEPRGGAPPPAKQALARSLARRGAWSGAGHARSAPQGNYQRGSNEQIFGAE